MLLSVLLYAYSHGVRSSRAIEQLCGRDAGYRFIVGEHVPDHTVIARFRRRHVERLDAVFVRVLKMCREARLIRPFHGAQPGHWRRSCGQVTRLEPFQPPAGGPRRRRTTT